MTLLHLDVLRVRVALHQDVDALAAIIYHAMPMDPQWDYRFPLRKKYPQDNYGHTRLMMKSMLEEQGVFINVVTFPTPGLREDQEIPAAVASTATRITPLHRQVCSAGNRRDANFEHTKAFGDYLGTAKKSYFDSTYQSHQLHLRILATHPDFERKGAGTALCIWGMERARLRHEPVTLFSSPMGEKLYSSLGFTYIGTVTVQVEGEQEKLSVGAMVYVPKSA